MRATSKADRTFLLLLLALDASLCRTSSRQASYRYQLIYRPMLKIYWPMLKYDDIGTDRDAIILFLFEIGHTWRANCMFEQAMAALWRPPCIRTFVVR